MPRRAYPLVSIHHAAPRPLSARGLAAAAPSWYRQERCALPFTASLTSPVYLSLSRSFACSPLLLPLMFFFFPPPSPLGTLPSVPLRHKRLARATAAPQSQMDVVSSFSLLHAKLSQLGFDDWDALSEGDVMTGNPHTYATFIRFLFHRFPVTTAALIRKHDWFVLELDDVNVGATTVRLLAAEAVQAPAISATQFGQCKYAAAKVAVCHALLHLLRSRSPAAPPRRVTDHRKRPAAPGPALADARVPVVKALVDRRRRELNALPRT